MKLNVLDVEQRTPNKRRVSNMKIEQTDEYCKGYNNGYDDGYDKALRRYHEGYKNGIKEGYMKGYSKAIEEIPQLLKNLNNPRIIVTTQDNFERVKEQFNII